MGIFCVVLGIFSESFSKGINVTHKFKECLRSIRIIYKHAKESLAKKGYQNTKQLASELLQQILGRIGFENTRYVS